MSFQAYRVESTERGFAGQWVGCEQHELPPGDVLVEVKYSSLNYKDALSAEGNKGVTRQYPHTPGIDAVGIVQESNDSSWPVGTEVVVFGYDLGMNTWGGFSQLIRVPGEWLLQKPNEISMKACMAWGTAGFTAALSVQKLLQYGLEPGRGPVLVTGATGGVGSVAVALLAKLGFEVHAVSAKQEQFDWLHQLGATEVIARDDLLSTAGKAMAKPRFAGAIDTVGGDYVSAILPILMPESAVTTCGMIAGLNQSSSVFPFILRGVALLGVDSVEISQSRKQSVLDSIAGAWRLDGLLDLVTEIGRDELSRRLSLIKAGQSVGRVVLDLNKA